MGSKPQPPRNLPSHLVVKLKTGWRFEKSGGVFTHTQGGQAPIKADLPRTCRITHLVPDLAEADPRSLEPEECDLALFVKVDFPKGSDAARLKSVVRAWACVDFIEPPIGEVSAPE